MMKKLNLIFLLSFPLFFSYAQETQIDHAKIKEDLDEILNDITHGYVYLEDKNIDLSCLREHYSEEIKNIKTEEETVLFFEYLLDEFYDNHLTLRTNRNSSYRLFAPVYGQIQEGKVVITNVWQTQIEKLEHNLVGAEILTFNGVDFDQVIEDFPTRCQDKKHSETREWIVNKILSGRYNEPRILTLKLTNNETIKFDLDQVKLKSETNLLTVKTVDDIGILRINNSLGNDNLVTAFDHALDSLSKTKGLIIDLRNTIFGGDSYEARGIMSRFIKEPRPYQKHALMAKSENNPDIERSWVEYVTPRSKPYENPVVVLVGRWTGSMGEGLAIGFEGMERATVVGTEMRRLAGEVEDFGFKNQWYGYKLSTAKLYHVNGTLRENYVPTHYVNQSTNEKDEILDEGIAVLRKMMP